LVTVPLSLVREAFARAGEKYFAAARVLYPTVFGLEWRWAILAFAYLKCLDDLVDEDCNRVRALATLRRQRELMARVYGGGAVRANKRLPDRYGAPLFQHDYRQGGALRPHLAALLRSMEFDTRRRGRRLSKARLDAYVLDLGGSVLHLFAALAAPGTTLPRGLIRDGSRAYLYADAMIDLRHDLALGVINVSREDIARYALHGGCDDERLARWIVRRAPVVLRQFERAERHLGAVHPRRLRLFIALYLAGKRRKLRRAIAATAAERSSRRRGGRRH
jgi:hypothetical protein